MIKIKLHVLPVLSMVALLAVSCQSEVNREQEAVMAVLKAESDAMITGDFESFKELHTQSELETRIEMGIYGYNVYRGWDRVSALVGDFLDGDPQENLVNTKENCIVHISGRSAWVTCDNVWTNRSSPDQILYNNLQIAFLEKQGGTWKISFSAYYTKGDQNEMTIH